MFARTQKIDMMTAILTALRGCRLQAVSIFAVYFLSCTVGIVMVHSGSHLAIAQRDKIVGDALQNDRAALNYKSGNAFTAAVIDCWNNLFFAAIPQTFMGLGVVPPYVTVAYQGWVGGVVSVDGSGRSRFGTLKTTVYYCGVLLLQTIAFSLSIGAGVKCGVDTYTHNSQASWRLWEFRIPMPSLRAVGYVYLVSIPLFFLGSCVEFLSPWNL
jgi:hypothetical protein